MVVGLGMVRLGMVGLGNGWFMTGATNPLIWSIPEQNSEQRTEGLLMSLCSQTARRLMILQREHFILWANVKRQLASN